MSGDKEVAMSGSGDPAAGGRAGMSSRVDPPGPELFRRPVDLFRFRRNPWDLHVKYAAEYGDIVRLGPKVVVLNHPDLVRDMFITDVTRHLRGPGHQVLKIVQGEGLVTSEEPAHAQQQRIVQPAFHRRRISEYGQVAIERTARMCSRWKHGQTIDVHKEMTHLTLGIVCKALFDLDTEDENSNVALALLDLMKEFPVLMMPFREYLERLGIGPAQRFKSTLEKFDRLVYDVLRERRVSAPDRGDLLSVLLQAQVDNNWTDQQVRDQCATLMMAGHETTASAMTFALYLLGRHPEVVERLCQELAEVIGSAPPSPESFPRLVYARMIFAEAIRLYPPIWAVARMIKDEYEISGYVMVPGTILAACQYSMHRDPRFFPEPDRFMPERFRPEAEAARPQFAYFPFGAGPRHCIGEGFAWLEGVLLLATIFQRWRFEPLSEQDMELGSCIALRPKKTLLLRLSSA
jgi:cytochrome P450